MATLFYPPEKYKWHKIEHSKAVTTVSPDRLNSRENKKMFHYSLKILYYNSETKAAKAVELKNLLLHLEV